MKKYFFNISEKVMNNLLDGEHLILSINGEDSEFIRINNAKIRQLGTVNDASLSMEFIKNSRKIGISFTLQKDADKDLSVADDARSKLKNWTK